MFDNLIASDEGHYLTQEDYSCEKWQNLLASLTSSPCKCYETLRRLHDEKKRLVEPTKMVGIYELDDRLETMEFYAEKSPFTAVNSKTSLNHSRWFRNLIWAYNPPGRCQDKP